MQPSNADNRFPMPHPHAGGSQVPATGGYAPAHLQLPMTPYGVAASPMVEKRNYPTIKELLFSLKRRWVLATLVGGLAAFFAAIAVWMMMPAGKHQARATIQFKMAAVDVKGAGNREEFEREKEAISARGKSRTFLNRVISTNPEVGRQPVIAESGEKARFYEDNLRLRWDSSEFLVITMSGDDPDQLKTLLVAYTKDLVEETRSTEEEGRKQKLMVLDTQIGALEKSIKGLKDDLNTLAKQGGTTPEGALLLKQLALERYKKSTQEIDGFKAAISADEAKLKLLEQEIASGKYNINRLELEQVLETNVTIAQLLLDVKKKRLDLDALEKSLNSNHPRLVEAQKEYMQSVNAVNAEKNRLRPQYEIEAQKGRREIIDREKADLINQRKLKEAQLAHSEKMKKDAEDDMKAIENGTTGIGTLTATINRYQTQLGDLDSERMKILGTKPESVSRIRLEEAPLIDLNRNLKQKLLAAGAIGIATLIGLIGLIGLLEWRNRRIDGVDQVVSELGLRIIGTIPAFPSRASLKSGEASQNQNWRFILNESVNSTRTMLLHTAKTQNMQVLMVTSAMQGEGKTSLSSQLATSMATAGLRTLIVDCDLRNPSMQKLFDISVAPGCSEVLLQEVDVSDVIQPTSVPNLWIIPAGQCNHRVVAALAQGQPLEVLFNRLRGQFDFIIVDSCPILPVADTLLLAQYVDGVVFSILQDVSQLPKVQNASERLIQLNIPLLGAVVNGIKPDIQAYGYNYVKQLPA